MTHGLGKWNYDEQMAGSPATADSGAQSVVDDLLSHAEGD